MDLSPTVVGTWLHHLLLEAGRVMECGMKSPSKYGCLAGIRKEEISR